MNMVFYPDDNKLDGGKAEADALPHTERLKLQTSNMAKTLLRIGASLLGVMIVLSASVFAFSSAGLWHLSISYALLAAHGSLAVFLFAFSFAHGRVKANLLTSAWVCFSISIASMYYFYVASWLEFDSAELPSPIWMHYVKLVIFSGMIAAVLGGPAVALRMRYSKLKGLS